MKNILTLLLAISSLYLASCGNGGNDSHIAPVVVPDSFSKGGYADVTYTNEDFETRSFFVNDLRKKGMPIYQLYGSVTYNHTDSLWHCQLQLIDQKMQKVAFTFYGSSPTSLGTYTATTHNSMLIDYTAGEYITYSILVGSTVNITQSTYPIEGSFNFTLYLNHFTTTATGSFKIYY